MFPRKSTGVRRTATRRGEVAAYCPDCGDIIWLDLLLPVGNEQGGRRPALVLSPRAFNELAGRCMACPITSHDRDWNLQVAIPAGGEVSGVVQSDQLRSASWEQRGSQFIDRAPAAVVDEV